MEQFSDDFLQLVNANIGIARKICGVYFENHDDRQDCFQEMMYQLWKSYPTFKGSAKFSTWMYRVCLNTALTYRKSAAGQGQPIDASHMEIPDASVKDDNAEVLLKAISQLSGVNKAIVLLYLEDHSYEEIASIIGITKSNVSVKLVRIKKELERILQSEF